MKKHEEDIARCRLVIMDGNVPLPTMDYILAACANAKVPGRSRIKTRLEIVKIKLGRLKTFTWCQQ